jgi:hypothetical protein
MLRISFVIWSSSSTGLINKATSSAYRESLCPETRRDRGCKSPELE